MKNLIKKLNRTPEVWAMMIAGLVFLVAAIWLAGMSQAEYAVLWDKWYGWVAECPYTVTLAWISGLFMAVVSFAGVAAIVHFEKQES